MGCSLLVFAAGLIGGMVNALMTDNGFALPQDHPLETGATVIRPGFLGNMLIGGVAALISWGLYGTFSAVDIIGKATPGGATLPSFPLSGLVGALLVGVGGARWLSNEVDKKLLRAAATEAASKQPNADAAKKIATGSPAQAESAARSLPT